MSLDWDDGHGTTRPLDMPGRGTVRGLLESERRRRALELSLTKANQALQDQNLRIIQQHISHSSLKDLTPEHLMCLLKLREFKGAESNGSSSDRFKAMLYGNLYERIGRLQSEIDHLNQKVDQMCKTAGGCRHWGAYSPVLDWSLPVPDRSHPVAHSGHKLPPVDLTTLAKDHSQLHREGCDLERLAQDAWARLGVLERDREVLGSQVMKLHCELVKTRSREQELQRDGVSARAELTGSRQLNDSLLQEIAVLKQRLASSEQQKALMESERRVLAARLFALETEREQLLSQKARLVQRLWRNAGAGCGPPAGPGGNLKNDAGASPSMEVGQEVMKTQVLHPCHTSSQEPTESLSPVPPRPLPSGVETGEQTEDMVQISEDPENGLEDSGCQQFKPQASPVVHGRRSIEYADWGGMGRALRNQKDFLSEIEHVQEGEAISLHTRTSQDDRDGPEGQSSWLSMGEEEMASKKHNQWHPWKDDPLSANQITALAIELQQLRRASEASLEVSNPAHSGVQQARDWLERIKLLKGCVRQMEMNEERLKMFCQDHTEVWQKEAPPTLA